MVSSSDFIHLPYTRDLTDGGIAYALRSLARPNERASAGPYDDLRNAAAKTAVALAFRRYLSAEAIPFEVKATNPFTNPDQYEVFLGGRRCSLQSFLISPPKTLRQIEASPEILLKAPALIDSDLNAAEGYSNRDIYLFAFLPARLNTSPQNIQHVIEAGQPHYFVHVMPEAWARPQRWSPLGALTVKSESAEAQRIEIGGQDAGRAMRSVVIDIPPRQRVSIEEPFFSLVYLHSKNKMEARLGVHSPLRKQTHIVSSTDWRNIWVYGQSILLAGYLTRGEFNQRADFLREGATLFPHGRLRTKHLSVNVCDLKPLSELFQGVNRQAPETRAGADVNKGDE